MAIKVHALQAALLDSSGKDSFHASSLRPHLTSRDVYDGSAPDPNLEILSTLPPFLGS
jgi:hypothetical protein